MELSNLKLTRELHAHLKNMGLKTSDDLKKEVKRQRAEIMESHKGSSEWFCKSGCSDCEDVLAEIWKLERKELAKKDHERYI